MVPSHRCQAERIKSAGTAKEMPVSDKGCKSKDFYASRSTLSMLFVTLQKKIEKTPTLHECPDVISADQYENHHVSI